MKAVKVNTGIVEHPLWNSGSPRVTTNYSIPLDERGLDFVVFPATPQVTVKAWNQMERTTNKLSCYNPVF